MLKIGPAPIHIRRVTLPRRQRRAYGSTEIHLSAAGVGGGNRGNCRRGAADRRPKRRPGGAAEGAGRPDQSAGAAVDRRRRTVAVRTPEARVARRAAHVEPLAAAGSRRHHHAFGSPLRTPSRRRAGDRSEAVLAADSRHGRSAVGVHARRSAALPRQVDDPRDGMLRQRRPRLSPRRQPDRSHAAADRRPDQHQRMDRRAARHADARSRRVAESHLVPRRRHGRRGDDAQHPDRQGVGRCVDCVWTERRTAASRAGLSGAAVPARRRRQRQHQVAAPHRSWPISRS